MDEKLLKTFEVYASYERRFAKAHASLPNRRPWVKSDREEIIDTVRDVLGFREELVPEIHLEPIESICCDGYSIEMMRFESWPGFYGALSLYKHDGDEKRPLVFIFPGHGEDGRLTEEYQHMAMELAFQGANVCLSDNIGQGERKMQGHRDAFAPFFCGMSFQGLIQLESVGLIRHFASLPWVDRDKLAACGNSGGGTICLFLCALAPELCAVASTGYPGDFEYILHKERLHCSCNLLPHVLSRVDMWEIYASFAPKPLLIEHGIRDTLIPIDRVKRCARKVGMSYKLVGCGERFVYRATDTEHSWADPDRRIIGEFFANRLGLSPYRPIDVSDILPVDRTYVEIPSESLTVTSLCERLFGVEVPNDLRLSDIFAPMYENERVDLSEMCEFVGKNEVARVLAQLESSL